MKPWSWFWLGYMTGGAFTVVSTVVWTFVVHQIKKIWGRR